MASAQDTFSIRKPLPAGSAAHAEAIVTGSYRVVASASRRGVQLGADAAFDELTKTDIALTPALQASVRSGLSSRAGLAVEAAVPLDLFSRDAGAGLVLRAQAQAEAAVFFQAEISLAVRTLFERAVREDSAPMFDLLRVFAEECEVSAGVWGRASASAYAKGEAVLAGTLVGPRPGFTLRADWGAGLGLGAGVETVCNIGFADPQRLLERLATRIADLVVNALRIGDDSAGDALAARITRALIPLAMRTAVTAGQAFGEPGATPETVRAATLRAACGSLLETTLELAVEAGMRELTRLLREALPPEVLQAVDGPERDLALQALGAAREGVLRLERLSLRDGADIAAAAEVLAGAVGGLLELPFLPAAAGGDARRAMVVVGLAGWLIADPRRLTATPPPLPEWITAGIRDGIRSSEPIDLNQVLAFLTGIDLDVLLQEGPAGELVAEIARITGLPPASLLLELARSFATGTPPTGLARSLGDVLGGTPATGGQPAVPGLLEETVLPALRAAVEGEPLLEPVVGELVQPLLQALPRLLVDRLLLAPDGDVDDDALREALSMLLLQALARFTIATTDVALHVALADGSGAIRAVAARPASTPRQLGLDELAAMLVRQPLSVALDAPAAKELLVVVADLMVHVDGQLRPPAIAAARELLAYGMTPDEQIIEGVLGLATGQPWPQLQRLHDHMLVTAAGARSCAGFVVPRLQEVVHGVYRRAGEEWVRGAQAIAQEVERRARQTAGFLADQVDAVDKLLADAQAELERLITRALDRVEAQRARVEAVSGGVIDLLAADGRAWIEALTPPPADRLFRPTLLGLWDRAMADASEVLTAPAKVLHLAIDLTKELLRDAFDAGTHSREMVLGELERRLRGFAEGEDLFVDLTVTGAFDTTLFSLGRRSVTVAEQVGAALRELTDDAAFLAALDQALADLREAVDQRARVQLLETDAGRAKDQAAMAALIDSEARASGKVAVRMSISGSDSLPDRTREVTVRIDNAPIGFTRAAAGMPPRIAATLNGRRIALRPKDFEVSSGGLLGRFEIEAVAAPPAPVERAQPTELFKQYAALAGDPAEPAEPAEPPPVVSILGESRPAIVTVMRDREARRDVRRAAREDAQLNDLTGALRHSGVLAPTRSTAVHALIAASAQAGEAVEVAAPSLTTVEIAGGSPAEAVRDTIATGTSGLHRLSIELPPDVATRRWRDGRAVLEGAFGVNYLQVSVAGGDVGGTATQTVSVLLGDHDLPEPRADLAITDVILDTAGPGPRLTIENRTGVRRLLRGLSIVDSAGNQVVLPSRYVPANGHVVVALGGSSGRRTIALPEDSLSIGEGDSLKLRDRHGRELSRRTI